jgi:hypothetical protein
MALVPGFEYDIFISYAHVDNAAFPGQDSGWIQAFYDNLNLMLAKRFGRMGMIKIWWDSKKLDGSVLFDNSIETGIKKSAIIICLNSPGYMQSPWCQKELNTFFQKAQTEKTGLKVSDRSRIIHVLLNNIPKTEWPEELNGTTGFPFHDAKEKDDLGDPVETLSPDFKTQMQNLRDAVWNLLKDFEKDEILSINQPETKVVKDDDAFTIYLGEVADTLRTPRKRVVAELEKQGFNVITGIPPPDEAEAHEQATKEAVDKAQLAVHFLDEYPGREIAGIPELWYPQKQTEISLSSGTKNMIWVPAETDFSTIEEEKYKLFLENLENGKASAKTYEFVRGSKSTIAQEIIDFALQIKAKQHQKKVEKGPLSVLLDTHFNDQLYALDLSRTLLENQIQPFINPQEDDPGKNINLLGERISQVRKLIFLYGNVSKEWVHERISVALRLILNNSYPIEDFFVYMAPPHKNVGDIAINQKFLKINIIDSSNKQVLDKAVLQKFLTDLKTEAV